MCSKEFTIEEREKQFPKKEKYFCSRKCSCVRIRSEKTKEKIKESVLKFNEKNGTLSREKKICPKCNKEFLGKKKITFCSKQFIKN